jgi:transcriptional regulator with XRE-family HTH domain
MNYIGNRVKEEREKRRLSLRELARSSGLSAPYILDIERGRRQPSDESLDRLAQSLGISKSALSDSKVRRKIGAEIEGESKGSESALSLRQTKSTLLKDEELIIRLIASGIMDLFHRLSISNQAISR